MEEETNSLIKNFRGQLMAKDAEFEMLEQQINKNEDDQMSDKINKIAELERKILKIKHEHDEEITLLKDKIEKYQDIIREKEMENESKILDFTSHFRKKETMSKSENFKLKKDMEVNYSKTNLLIVYS